MLQLWNVRHALQDIARRIEQELQRSDEKRLLVRARTGAGRHTIARQLSNDLGAHVVEFPSYDLDAPLHGLVQLGSAAGSLGAVIDERGIGDAVRATVAILADQNRPLVVILPAPRGGHPRGETDVLVQRRIDEIVSAAESYPPLTLIVLATESHRLRGIFEAPALDLAIPLVSAADLDPQLLPERFAHAASELARWMVHTGTAFTPLEARLQVGLLALGERPSHANLEALARAMSHQLRHRWRTLGTAVGRMLVARRPVAVTEVQTVSGIEQDWLPLLTTCIGYGDETIRIPEVTRRVLLEALQPTTDELEAAHAALADYHETLDGTVSLKGLDQERAIHWMEKVHHLALGGDRCASKWGEQDAAGREQLWERARYLSHVQRRFAEAVELYRRCIEEFGPDSYSRHYLAYNLERSRKSLGEVRENYSLAAAGDMTNPWWQQRWVRFLIAHGTVVEARAAWRDAIRAIDPDGVRIQASPWLALNLHYWVARRWLALGRVDDARAVLDEIPQRWLEEESELRELVQVVSAEQEDRNLGESVYPASIAVEERWKRPRILRSIRGGRALVFWAPGRVVDADREQVTIVIAPRRGEAQQVTFDAATWRRIAGEPAEDAEGFLEYGRYEGEDEVIRHVADDGEGSWLEAESAELSEWVWAWPH